MTAVSLRRKAEWRKQVITRIGERIKAGRKAQGITQQMLAAKTGVPVSTVNNVECARFGANLLSVVLMCKALSLSVDLLDLA